MPIRHKLHGQWEDGVYTEQRDIYSMPRSDSDGASSSDEEQHDAAPARASAPRVEAHPNSESEAESAMSIATASPARSCSVTGPAESTRGTSW